MEEKIALEVQIMNVLDTEIKNKTNLQVTMVGLKEGLNKKVDLRSAVLERRREVDLDRKKRAKHFPKQDLVKVTLVDIVETAQ